MPVMKFCEAIRDGYAEIMRKDKEVFLIGVGVSDPKAVFGTLDGLLEEFGADRVVEGPLAEQMLTGLAFGAATLGMRPVLIHHRVDFLPLTFDQIASHCAKWRYMFGAQQNVPLVIRGIVGRGWGNGPQHTQSLHSLMAHIPGIKVVVPATPADAKGLTISSILDNEPVIFIEHRWNHEDAGEVSAGFFETPIGKANILRSGSDVTVVAIGPMVQEALKAADALAVSGKSLEVIDLRTIRPLDYETVKRSVQKTRHLIVADPDWPQFGSASAIISYLAQHAFGVLATAPVAITWPDHPVPASYGIDVNYYPTAKDIINAVSKIFAERSNVRIDETIKHLAGPF